MVRYIYKALANNKDVIDGEIEAVTMRDARAKISELGYVPIKIFEPELVVNELAESADNKGGIRFFSLSDKIMFVSELQVMISSGISVVDALHTISDNAPKYKVKSLAKHLRNEILRGKTFAEAINCLYHDAFGETFIDLCVTGENSGELDKTLDRIATMLRKQEDIKGNILQASIYPCIVILIMFALLILFAKFVFPALTSFIISNGADIPCFASTVKGTLDFIGNYWWFCILSFFAMIGAVYFIFSNCYTKKLGDKFLLSIPIIKDFVTYINLANYMCILNISYDTGVPFMHSLDLAKRTISNSEIALKADDVSKYMGKGCMLSEAFKKSGLLPGAFVTMIASGEKAGNLSKMLQDCVSVIDKKIDLVVKSLMKAFEPALIIILGGIVLIIAIAFVQMYVSMFSSMM